MFITIPIAIISCGNYDNHHCDYYDGYYHHDDYCYGYYYDSVYVYKTKKLGDSITPKNVLVKFNNLAFDYCEKEAPVIKIKVKRVGIDNGESIDKILIIDNPKSTTSRPAKIKIIATENSDNGDLIFSPETSCGSVNATITGLMVDDISLYPRQGIGIDIVDTTINGKKKNIGDTTPTKP